MFSVHETNGTSGLSTCIVHILNTFLLMAAFSKLMRPQVGWTRTGLLHHGVAEIISCPLLAPAQRCDNFTRPCRWSPSPAAWAWCHEPGPDTDGWNSGPQDTFRYWSCKQTFAKKNIYKKYFRYPSVIPFWILASEHES